MKRTLPIVLALAAGGCDVIFGLDRPQLRGDAGTVVFDARELDAPDGDVKDDAKVFLDAPDAAMCAGYTLYNGSYYRVVTQQTTWLLANADCIDDGTNTHLVVPSNNTEGMGYSGVITNVFWVGMSDRVSEGSYLAVTDEPIMFDVTSNWANGEPDGLTSDCLAYRVFNGYEDRPCDINSSYICECDAYPADPGNY